ncbi:MAG: glutamate--tRNA ligase [Chloroflexi bacterium]|nr:glutamate--tRNA ligase [Chloroflexota bacterium]
MPAPAPAPGNPTRNGPARVRFAPSPTGDLHIGGVRTALFNYLVAKNTGGQFILRLEDTDQNRIVEGSIDSIYDSLRWLGLDWDEGPDVGGPYGPYVQSENVETGAYAAAAKKLIEGEFAYECDCTPERLERVRERQKAAKQAPGYDGHCRTRSRDELADSRIAGNSIVVRLKVPRTKTAIFEDVVRGRVSIKYQDISDFVILKSDGFPTYHLAHIVDDDAMKITHVLRGEEWLPSVPRHLLIYEGLGIDRPVYAHLPVILAEDKTKLSKRHGAVSALEFRDEGFLPDALFNFLSLLGWSPGDDREVMDRDEIASLFTLDRVKEAPAIFDRTKLEWMNGQYIRNLSLDSLTDAALPFLEKGLPAHVTRPVDRDRVRPLLAMTQERLKYLTEAPEQIELFFEDSISPAPEEIIQKKMDAASTAAALESSLQVLREFEPFEVEPLEARFRELAAELDLKVGALFGSIRVATTGRRIAPPLFDTIVALGRDKTISRTEAAIDSLKAVAG